ncbi:alternative ribosome rescue aminoacyl-tRNA hydrolase ArfB [Actinomadura alba]|uniref:Aminoacyl-tRNA hydrolase n=1 Tax=Actinomadura alba TaxID=406431 RepID=A0ABR7LPR3_9ACTN|nr:alternative ribosome rescue aminoacyl-tRNA hydrolase ArfB [Actinomadura alba]MBC6466378.1 aminoacyl-tRNA hydrolase [Actinomadura alba]
MPGSIHLRGSVVIPATEFGWRFSRSSGPGGQHVNTSSTAAELSFDLAGSPSIPDPLKQRALARLSGRLVNGVITIRAEEHRSQLRNREAAQIRLAALLTEATAPPPKQRRPTKPSRGMRERRLESKHRRSEIKRLRSRRHDY